MNLSVPPRQSHGQSWAANQGSKEGGTQGKPQPLVPIQKISQAQMEDRRKKGCVIHVILNGFGGMSVVFLSCS
jgi:hypothetical protein